jgi:hypothetical protein
MNLKIIITLIAVAIFSSYKSEAQLPHLSLYVHGLYASGLNNNAQDYFKFGLGANAGLTLGSKNTRGVVSLGYTNFFAKHDSPIHEGDETYIPVKVGIRKYLPLTLHTFFLQGDLGAGFTSFKNDNDTKTGFAADIGVGAHFSALEVAVMYDGFHHPYGWTSWLTLQLGFNIGI